MSTPSSNIFSRPLTLYGHEIKATRAFVAGLALSAIALYVLKKVFISTRQEQINLSDNEFWQRVSETPTMANEEAPVVIGKTKFENMACNENLSSWWYGFRGNQTESDLGTAFGDSRHYGSALVMISATCLPSSFEPSGV